MTQLPCAKCRDWDDCSGFNWYSISDIRYCRKQVFWLVNNFLRCDGDGFELTQETWPVEPTDTGYTDAPKTSHGTNLHAPFEKPMQVIGELEYRLLKTGKDGRLLVFEVNHSDSLSGDARAALGYACGWRRKRMDYMTWRRHKKGIIYGKTNRFIRVKGGEDGRTSRNKGN